MSWINFHPDHREDLAKSGLTCRVVEDAKIHSLRPCDIGKKIKIRNIDHIQSALSFPYLGEDGFCRYKIFWKDGFGAGFKYYQAPKTGSRLYVTKTFLSSLSNSNKLYITEGEKKALKLSMSGMPACAISGVWNFGDRVLNRLKNLRVNKLFYIPDNDIWGRKNLEQSIIRFNSVLQSIDCQMEVIAYGRSR